MELNGWIDGDVGNWFLRSLSYDVKHPIISWASSGQRLRHGDLVCLRGDVNTGKSLILTQILAEFLIPKLVGGFGAECLLLLGNDGISPPFLKEQILAQLKHDRKEIIDAKTIDDLLEESLKNLHVVSVHSVDELEKFVLSLPALLKTSLKNCRIIFVDDLDLGIASAVSFGPQTSHLSDVLRRFLQISSFLGFLMIYGMNRRVTQQQQLHLSRRETEKEIFQNDVFAAAASSCCFDKWRAPKKFILHAFKYSPNFSKKAFSWEPSYFIFFSNSEKKAFFVLKEDGRFQLLNT